MNEYRGSDGLAMADKVHATLPPGALNDLRRGTRVVHRMRRHNVLTVWGPTESQHMGRASTLTAHKQDMDRTATLAAHKQDMDRTST